MMRAALRRTVLLLIVGSAAGLFLGIMATRVLAMIVYQASALDPMVLLGVLATIALVANALGWLRHRQWWRGGLGMVGPALVLAAILLFGQRWTAELLYTGLALMVGVSLWDLLAPAHRNCGAKAATR